MSRRRRLHCLEVFHLKDRLLASLARKERLGLIEQPHEIQAAMETLFPLLQALSLLEVQWSDLAEAKAYLKAVPSRQLCLPLDEPQANAVLMSGRQLAILQDYREQLLNWSETYLSTEQWQRLQDALRQRRKVDPPTWLQSIEQALQPPQSDNKAPRWVHPNKDQERFASRLLVPKRSEVSHPSKHAESIAEHARPP